MSQLFDKTILGLSSAINFRNLRNNVISANIANAETPGYKSKQLDFEEALSRALDIDGLRSMTASDPRHIAMGKGAISRISADVYENPEGNLTNDDNTVDLEKEMATLSENTIMYKAALELINKKLGALRYAVTEGAK